MRLTCCSCSTLLSRQSKLLTFFLSSIDLPVTVSKSMFNRDLGFYGINSEGGINQESLTEVVSAFHHTKVEHDMFFLAFEAYYQYGIKKSQTLEYVQVDIGRDHKLFDTSGIGPEGKSLFENYLDKYFGLQVCMGSQAENRPMFQATRCGSFFVCAKDEA